MRRACAFALAVGAAIGIAGPPTQGAQAASAARVSTLSGSGDWIVAQDYGGGAGVTFDQHFSFRLRAGHQSRLALAGGSVKVPVRVTVPSSAKGASIVVGATPGQLNSYTCTATAIATDAATIRVVRVGGAFRMTSIVLRALSPGGPRCTPSATIEWPTGDDWFAHAMTARTTLGATSLFRAVQLRWPTTINDCSNPALVGTCSEQLAWSGTVWLRRS